MIYNMIYNLTNGGGGVDFSALTATPADVAEGKTFYGSGSEDVQTGTNTPVQCAWGIRKSSNRGFTVSGLTFTPTMVFWKYIDPYANNKEGAESGDSSGGFDSNSYIQFLDGAIKFGDISQSMILVDSIIYTAPSGITIKADGFSVSGVSYGFNYYYIAANPRIFWFASTLTE